MAIKSLGERLGFVSAGDVRRAREREIRIESEKRGEAKGFAKGEAIGFEKGEVRGRKEERQKAEQEHLQKTLQSAREMLRDGIPLENVARYQNLSEEQVKALL